MSLTRYATSLMLVIPTFRSFLRQIELRRRDVSPSEFFGEHKILAILVRQCAGDFGQKVENKNRRHFYNPCRGISMRTSLKMTITQPRHFVFHYFVRLLSQRGLRQEGEKYLVGSDYFFTTVIDR